MNKVYVSLSFDDARKDSFRAINIANKYGLKATLNVTSAYVLGGCSVEESPCILPAMSSEEVFELYKKGNEIACHGHKHNNELINILDGKHSTIKMIGESDEYPIGFASPNSKLRLDKLTIDTLKDNFAYVRMGPFLKKVTFIHKVLRKFARITKSCLLFRLAYGKVKNVKSPFILVSVPVLRDNTAKQLISLIKHNKTADALIIIMFHSILKPGEKFYSDSFSWPLSSFESFCQLLTKEKNIRVVNTEEWIRKFQND